MVQSATAASTRTLSGLGITDPGHQLREIGVSLPWVVVSGARIGGFDEDQGSELLRRGAVTAGT